MPRRNEFAPNGDKRHLRRSDNRRVDSSIEVGRFLSAKHYAGFRVGGSGRRAT